MNLISIAYKATRRLLRSINSSVDTAFTNIYLKANNVSTGRSFKTNGRPVIDVWSGGTMSIGDFFSMNNGPRHNPIGRQQRCIFIVASGAKLSIGNHVGVSSVAIVCHKGIAIGDHVKIGGNVVIYDTDFHSLNRWKRSDPGLDRGNTKKATVSIGDYVFIGAHSTILKGVTIGENAIIGAGSVVTRDVPANEIWGGNPARFIKRLPDE